MVEGAARGGKGLFFAHMADCHLGGWRDPTLREANHQAFCAAIQRCIDEKVAFVIIAGDLFNTAVPGLESIRLAVEQLRRLRDNAIPLYFVPGSHDSSASGKSVLDIIESAGLGINLARGDRMEDGRLALRAVKDKGTGVTLCGLLGRRGGLEKNDYESLCREPLEKLPGPKIFVFHGAIDELKPDDLSTMTAFGVSLLPRGFDYYAGGHVHIVKQTSLPGYLNVVYPGPVFPNSFAELEKLGCGSFCLVRDWHVEHVRLERHPVVSVTVDVGGKSAADAETAIRRAMPTEAQDAIVLCRIHGTLASGGIGDIRLSDACQVSGALTVLRNTNALQSAAFDEAPPETGTLDEIEERLVREHAGERFGAGRDAQLLRSLMQALSVEKHEGEKINDFESRVLRDADALLRDII